ncbi:MAG: hypothetical protein AB1498_11065 [bacterium]
MNRYSIFLTLFLISFTCLRAEEFSNEKKLFIQTEQSIKKDILLPEKFLTNKTFGKRMLYSDDKDVFLAYLFLLKNFTGDVNGEVKVKYADIKEYLCPDMTSKKAYDKITKILNILYKKYELIEFDPHFKDNPGIKLLSLKEDHLPYKYPNIDYLVIPETLWIFGWEKRLSFTGLFTYFINLMEIKLIPFDTHWEIDPDMLALKYNLSLSQINEGLEELLQYNLLEAFSSKEINIFNNKPKIKYKVLVLYSWEITETQWKNVNTNYNKKDIEKAVKYAAIIYKKYDPDTVEEILKLMKKFPANKIRKAFKILSEKSISSEERSLVYLLKIIKNI